MQFEPLRIAILDDDPGFMGELARFLSVHGLSIAPYLTPEEFFAAHKQTAHDLLILDQMLERSSGLEVLRRLRTFDDVPCIILTGLEDEVDRVVGLEAGADDYVTKLATPREILARIRAVRRRTAASSRLPSLPQQPPMERNWVFCQTRRLLKRPDGTEVHLTGAEYELLRVLQEKPGALWSRAELCELALRRPFRVTDRSVDNLVVRLRKKLEPDPTRPSPIKTVRPAGYVFVGF